MEHYDSIWTDPDPEALEVSDRAGATYPPGTRFWTIVQIAPGMAKAKLAHAGEFCTKNEEGELEFLPRLEVVVLQSGPRSTRFEAQHVACRSYDGVTGQSGKDCRKECEYYWFRENNIESQDKCKNSRLLLCVPSGALWEEPFFLQISPAGIQDWQKYASWLQDQKHRPVFACTTQITTEQRKMGKGTPYVPVFRPIRALDPGDLAVMRDRRVRESYRFKAPDAALAAMPDVVPADAEAGAPDEYDGYIAPEG